MKCYSLNSNILLHKNFECQLAVYCKHIFIVILFLSITGILNTEEYIEYRVKQGETLWRISKEHNFKIDELCKINNITDKTKVKSGTIIKIPAEKNIPSKIKITDETSDKQEFILYKLKHNETIWKISKKYGIKLEELCRINNIVNVSNIKTGTVIRIPQQFEYIDYRLPLCGEIEPIVNSHFKGVSILTSENKDERIIYNMQDGKIAFIDNIPGYGLTLFIRHSNNLTTTYSGFEEIYVKAGMDVKSNQKLGLAGNLARYCKYGIIFSIQINGKPLKFDVNKKKFVKNPI